GMTRCPPSSRPVNNRCKTMATLAELIGRRPTPGTLKRRKGAVIPLTEQTQVTAGKPHATYEAQVFHFLLGNKQVLGIKGVSRFKALLLGGAVELTDGRRLAVEVKFRMNWLKACQAEWQFRTFLKRHTAVAGPIDGGIVFFEAFSGDWLRPDGS